MMPGMPETSILENRRARPLVKRLRTYQFVATSVVLLLITVSRVRPGGGAGRRHGRDGWRL